MGNLPKPDHYVEMIFVDGPKLVFLDYDLTLMDTFVDFYEAVNEARRHYGLEPLSFQLFMEYFINDTLTSKAPPPHDQVGFWRYFRRVYSTRHGHPMPGAHHLLYMLRLWGSRNVIVTGRECPSMVLWGELRRYGLEWGIDMIYTMHDLERIGGVEETLFDKSWLLKYILNLYGVEPSEALMIGDYRLDAQSALKAGIVFIGLSNIPKRARDLYDNGACRVVETLYDVPVVIHEIFYEKKCLDQIKT